MIGMNLSKLRSMERVYHWVWALESLRGVFGPKPNGPEAVCRTISIKKNYYHINGKIFSNFDLGSIWIELILLKLKTKNTVANK